MAGDPGSGNDPGQLGEFGLINRIAARLGPLTDERVLIGPGDDSAVLAGFDDVVVSTDVYLEGVHFRLDWSTAVDIGHKVAAAALADVAAMGAVSRAIVVGLAMPAATGTDWVDGLTDGLRLESAAAGADVVGGDLVSGPNVMLTVTALGSTAGLSAVTRAGASPGDVVVLAGRQGLAAAGLALLVAGDRHGELIDAHRRPRVPYAAARQLAQAGATSMIDVSDGLLADLTHVARASKVAIELDLSVVPIDPRLSEAGDRLGIDPLRWIATGGEDHAIVATIASDDLDKNLDKIAITDALTIIGRVVEGDPKVRVIGRPDLTESQGGWTHFRS